MSTYTYEKGKNSEKTFEATVKIKFKYSGNYKDLAKEVSKMCLLGKNDLYEWEDNDFDILKVNIETKEAKNESNSSGK